MRKTQTVVIEAPGRDLGKTFLLREMPVRQSEWWGARLLSAMARSGVDIPADIGGVACDVSGGSGGLDGGLRGVCAHSRHRRVGSTSRLVRGWPAAVDNAEAQAQDRPGVGEGDNEG